MDFSTTLHQLKVGNRVHRLHSLRHLKTDDKRTVSQKRKLRKRVVFTYMRRRTWIEARCAPFGVCPRAAN